MARRKGLGKGKGRGYKNLIPKDPKVHSDSAMGRKQPQRIPLIGKPSPTIYRQETAPDGTKFKIQQTGMNWTLFVKEKESSRWDKIQSCANALDCQQIMMNQKELKDSDKDGVADKFDCDPNDPTKQDRKTSFQKYKESGMTEQERTDQFVNKLGRNRAEQLSRLWRNTYPRYMSIGDEYPQQHTKDEVFEYEAKKQGFSKKELELFDNL